MNNSFEQSEEQSQENELGLGATALSQGGPLQLVQPSPVSGIQANALNSNSNQCELPGSPVGVGQMLMIYCSHRLLERLAWISESISRYA